MLVQSMVSGFTHHLKPPLKLVANQGELKVSHNFVQDQIFVFVFYLFIYFFLFFADEQIDSEGRSKRYNRKERNPCQERFKNGVTAKK